MRTTCLLICLIMLCSGCDEPAQDAAESEADSLMSEAVRELNSGRIIQAKAAFGDILHRFPDAHRAYFLYWLAVGKSQSSDTLRAIIAEHLSSLELVPLEERGEDYYSTVKYGYEKLGDSSRSRALEREEVRCFPRGLAAQLRILDDAEADPDPLQSAAKFQAYMDAFPEKASWVESAARQRFEVIAENRGQFDKNAIVEAAEQWEAKAKRFVDVHESPGQYIRATTEIADALAETDPARALEFADSGIRFIDERWTTTDSFDDRTRFLYYPAMLRANVAQESWNAAQKVGAALVRELNTGHPLGAVESSDAEAKIRRLYALALEQQNDIETARLHFAWAAMLSEKETEGFDAFSSRHELSVQERERCSADLQQRVAELDARRESLLRSVLLATEQRRPAFDFDLATPDGRRISLEGLRGKVVVVTFWASWCAPCVAELEEWKHAYEALRTDPGIVMLAVSVDRDKAEALELINKEGYDFPVLLGDGSVEAPYELQGIPQLCIIDREGMVRFQHKGYKPDGLFLKKLEWMIDAVANRGAMSESAL